MEHLRYKPKALFRLDDASSPFADYAGYGKTATLTGTLTRGLPLCMWNTSSLQVDAANTLTYANSPVYTQTADVSKPFSIAASVFPIVESEGIAALTYRENLSTSPIPQATGTLETKKWEINGSYWNNQSTHSIQSSGGIRGDKYYRKTITASTNSSNGIFVIGANVDNATLPSFATTQGIPVTPGDTLTVSLYVRNSLASITFDHLKYRYYDAAGVAVGAAVTGPNTTLTANNWGRLSVTFTVPDGVAFVAMRTDANATAIGATFDATAVLVERTDTLKPYFDGSMPGYEFAGTNWASISRTRTDVARINYAPNSSFEVSTAGALNYPGPSGAATISRQTSGGRFGTSFARSTWTTAATAIGGGMYETFTALPGALYTVSAYLRTSRNGQKMVCRIEWKDGAGTLISNSTLGTTVTMSANTWARVSAIGITAPAQAATCTVTFYNIDAGSLNWQVGDTLDMDGVLFEDGVTLNPFYDGDSSGASWGGTAGTSWSYIEASAQVQQIVSSSGKYDGLTIKGTVVSFGTSYSTTGSATASYDMQLTKRFDVVGVHTQTKNTLYLDGKLVSEVDISAAQQTDTYAVSGTSLFSGNTTGADGLLLNMVALYDSALTTEAVTAIYNASNRRSNAEGLKSFNGHEVTMGRAGTIYEWKTNDDWNQATMENCAVEKDTLFAQTYNGLTFAATWYDTIDLSATSTGLTIHAVDVYYTGQNVLLEASLDNSTWQTVTVGDNLSVVPQGTSADNMLFLRATFPPGVPEAKLTYLGVRIYTDSTYTPPVSGRTLTFTNPTTLVNTRQPMDMYEDNGFHLNNAPLLIGADTADVPIAIQTIEIWFKPLDDTSADDTVLIDTRPTGTGAVELTNWSNVTATASTFYRNGKSDASLPITRRGWNVVHLVLNAATSGAFYINGLNSGGLSANIMLGKVVLYQNALTASDIAKIVANYTGVPVTTQNGSGAITMTESTPATAVVAYDYAVVATE